MCWIAKGVEIFFELIVRLPARAFPQVAFGLKSMSCFQKIEKEVEYSLVSMPTNAQISRYSRQILVPAIGIAGQSGLLNSKVLVIGAGGLGSPCILYLAAAGVGHIGVVDYDTVEISNLQRQIIHSETRIGLKKCESALTAIRNLNSDIIAVAYDVVLSSSNAKQIVAEYDIVCDCSDNVATRYLVNDVCVLLGKPLVSGGALRMDGQLTVYNYKGSPCYRCLFPTPPDPSTVTNCSDGGVLGVVTGIIGSAQALEVIRIITGMNKGDRHRMLVFDAQEMAFRTIKLRPRNRNCAICGDSPTITDVIDYIKFCGSSANDVTSIIILDSYSTQHTG